MEHLNKEDLVWLHVVEYFALSDADVILARHVLSLDFVSFVLKARIFSEHYLVATTGWTEYVIRRVLGHWQNMGMAKSKSAPTKSVVVSQIRFGSGILSSNKLLTSRRKHTGLTLKLSIENVPLDKNRVERCAQQWEIDTNIFFNSLHHRICWVRNASYQTYNKMTCGCEISDPFQHIPNCACTALVCEACGKEVTEEDAITGFNLADTPLFHAYTITIGGKFTPWVRPTMPDSLHMRRTSEGRQVKDEEYEDKKDEVGYEDKDDEACEEKEDEEEWVDCEEDDEVEVAVRGVLKRWSHLTEKDLQHMTDEEYAIFAKLYEEDECKCS